jgi:hypothetical protein
LGLIQAQLAAHYTVVTVYGLLGHVVLLVIHQLAFSVQTTAAIQAELAFAKAANLAEENP